MDTNATYELELAFVDESESFVLGWEARAVWEKLLYEEQVVSFDRGFPLHAKNTELYMRMGKVKGFTLSVEPAYCENGAIVEEYIYVTFIKNKPEEKKKPTLRLVE